MAVLTTIAFTAFLLEDDYLVTLYEVFKHFTYYLGALYSRSANGYITIGVDEENLIEFYRLTVLGILAEIVYIQEFVSLSLKLLALNFYNSVHFKKLYFNRLTRRASD